MTTSQLNMIDFKERIRQRWKESINMPRKKKKRVRKELLLDWQIANWDPFGGLF